MRLISVLFLATLASGCGYGKSMASAPQPGVVPAIMALMPSNVNAGGGAFVLTVNGSSFASNAMVKWNGMAQNSIFVTSNQLTAMIPASAITTPGTVAVTVTNPATPGMGGIYGASGGTAAETSNPMTFTIN
jgi:hypothetical protein